jgi:hypothetical protein
MTKKNESIIKYEDDSPFTTKIDEEGGRNTIKLPVKVTMCQVKKTFEFFSYEKFFHINDLMSRHWLTSSQAVQLAQYLIDMQYLSYEPSDTEYDYKKLDRRLNRNKMFFAPKLVFTPKGKLFSTHAMSSVRINVKRIKHAHTVAKIYIFDHPCLHSFGDIYLLSRRKFEDSDSYDFYIGCSQLPDFENQPLWLEFKELFFKIGDGDTDKKIDNLMMDLNICNGLRNSAEYILLNQDETIIRKNDANVGANKWIKLDILYWEPSWLSQNKIDFENTTPKSIPETVNTNFTKPLPLEIGMQSTESAKLLFSGYDRQRKVENLFKFQDIFRSSEEVDPNYFEYLNRDRLFYKGSLKNEYTWHKDVSVFPDEIISSLKKLESDILESQNVVKRKTAKTKFFYYTLVDLTQEVPRFGGVVCISGKIWKPLKEALELFSCSSRFQGNVDKLYAELPSGVIPQVLVPFRESSEIEIQWFKDMAKTHKIKGVSGFAFREDRCWVIKKGRFQRREEINSFQPELRFIETSSNLLRYLYSDTELTPTVYNKLGIQKQELLKEYICAEDSWSMGYKVNINDISNSVITTLLRTSEYNDWNQVDDEKSFRYRSSPIVIKYTEEDCSMVFDNEHIKTMKLDENNCTWNTLKSMSWQLSDHVSGYVSGDEECKKDLSYLMEHVF